MTCVSSTSMNYGGRYLAVPTALVTVVLVLPDSPFPQHQSYTWFCGTECIKLVRLYWLAPHLPIAIVSQGIFISCVSGTATHIFSLISRPSWENRKEGLVNGWCGSVHCSGWNFRIQPSFLLDQTLAQKPDTCIPYCCWLISKDSLKFHFREHKLNTGLTKCR